ncbi:IPT/TIG domain-containing protein [Klugiella xanthotipulae]|uniref:IPT/TIG domain-containing protein n=1 Tax=Klugiella xanthotipulae TaxID=244735 RepID=UPI001476970C|nr:IPT/TIG domain-containing protein [Klugiella xanthotipulae]
MHNRTHLAQHHGRAPATADTPHRSRSGSRRLTYPALVAVLALGCGSLSLPAYATDGDVIDGQSVAEEVQAAPPAADTAPEALPVGEAVPEDSAPAAVETPPVADPVAVESPAEAPVAGPPVPVAAAAAAPSGITPFAGDTILGSVSPATGDEAGGTTVILTGECFTDAEAVIFELTSAASFVVDSDTQITAVTPAGSGTVPVQVVGGPGCTFATLPNAFTYEAPVPVVDPPVVTSLTPDRGPVGGGSDVTITGENLADVTGVTVDGIAATGLTGVTDTSLTVTTPSHAAGPVDVVVTTTHGTSNAGLFTYHPVASVTGVSPGSGSDAGGTTVTITGTCFVGATGVTFGGTPAVSYSVLTDSTLTAETPAGTGTVDVSVATTGECGSGATLAGSFTYTATVPAVPTITGISPTEGPDTGGTTVTVTGTNLDGIQEVTVDGTAVAQFSLLTDTSLTFVTEAHAPGSVVVRVRDASDESATSSFTFVAAPVVEAPAITSLSPTRGTIDGGTLVTITGERLGAATAVAVGGTAVAAFTTVSDTEITFETAAHAAGTVDVTVTDANGESAPAEFTFFAPLAVTGILPATGSEAGGETVTITGTCFTGAVDVLFGSEPATSFVVVTDTSISAVVPAGSAGLVNVTVTGSVECGNSVLTGGYEYVTVVQPVLGSITPDSGPATGGTVVTATGSGFETAVSVTFDGLPATNVTVVSDTEITVVTPAHGAGVVDVVVNGPTDSALQLSPFAVAFAGITPAASNAVSFTYEAVTTPGVGESGGAAGNVTGGAAGAPAPAPTAVGLAVTGLGGVTALLSAALLALVAGRFLLVRARRGELS